MIDCPRKKNAGIKVEILAAEKWRSGLFKRLLLQEQIV